MRNINLVARDISIKTPEPPGLFIFRILTDEPCYIKYISCKHLFYLSHSKRVHFDTPTFMSDAHAQRNISCLSSAAGKLVLLCWHLAKSDWIHGNRRGKS